MLPAPYLFWAVECTETQALMAIGMGVVFEVAAAAQFRSDSVERR